MDDLLGAGPAKTDFWVNGEETKSTLSGVNFRIPAVSDAVAVLIPIQTAVNQVIRIKTKGKGDKSGHDEDKKDEAGAAPFTPHFLQTRLKPYCPTL